MVMMNISTLSDRLRKKRDTLFRRSASDLDDRVVQEWQYLKFDPNRSLRAGSTSERPQVAPQRPGAFQRLTRATSTLGLSGTLPRSIASGALNANAEKARVAPLWAGTKIRPPPNGVRSPPERVVSPVNSSGSRIPIRMPSLRLKVERREQTGGSPSSAQERLLTKRYSLENLLEAPEEADGAGCICEECVNRNNNREHKRRSSQCIEVKALEKSRKLLGKTKSAPDYAAEKNEKKTPNGKDQAAGEKRETGADKAKDKRQQHRRQKKAAQKASDRASQKAFEKARKEQKQREAASGRDVPDSAPTRRAGKAERRDDYFRLRSACSAAQDPIPTIPPSGAAPWSPSRL